jgi:hypothetical protein
MDAWPIGRKCTKAKSQEKLDLRRKIRSAHVAVSVNRASDIVA